MRSGRERIEDREENVRARGKAELRVKEKGNL